MTFKELLIEVFTWWNGQTMGTRFYTWRKGRRVGEDDTGNIYYESKDGARRWVIYNGEADASKIPPGWHGWMHQRTDVAPSEEKGYQPWPWQKPHMVNPTGTAAAHRPQGSILGAAKRAAAGGDYVAWKPE